MIIKSFSDYETLNDLPQYPQMKKKCSIFVIILKHEGRRYKREKFYKGRK